MTSVAMNQWLPMARWYRPDWWAGPILRKELCVTSRQRKYYLLRLAYVGLLCAVIFHFWHSIAAVGGGSTAVGQVARSGEVGKRVIVTIVWFQFVAAQVLAVVLLSDAISSEVRRRTLEGLLVTPIGAIQIVLGKLLSRLLQVILLLAISLPVLAVARVFGGVPWDYVVSGLCITLCVLVLAGSLSLYYSTWYPHPYRVVRAVTCWYLIFCSVEIPGLVFWLGSMPGRPPWSSDHFGLVNPFAALLARTQVMLTGPVPRSAPAPLVWHCLILLAAAVTILVYAIRRLQGIAWNWSFGPDDESLREATDEPANPGKAMKLAFGGQEVRRVTDPPMVWKELSPPLFQARDQALLRIGAWALGVPLALIVAALGLIDSITYSILAPVAWVVQWVFILRLGVAAASSVAREKEAHTWPILLVTPLENNEIIWGKTQGAFRKNLSLLIPVLVLYSLAFLSARPGERGLLHQIFDAGAPALHLAGMTLFLLGAGFYAGLRCRTATAAMAYLFGTFLGLMLLMNQLPTGGLAMPRHDYSGDLPGTGVYSILAALVCGGVGLLALRQSARKLRRSVFQ